MIIRVIQLSAGDNSATQRAEAQMFDVSRLQYKGKNENTYTVMKVGQWIGYPDAAQLETVQVDSINQRFEGGRESLAQYNKNVPS